MKKQKNRVHLRIEGNKYLCNVNRRWGSSQITSAKYADYVTCKNCLRILAARFDEDVT